MLLSLTEDGECVERGANVKKPRQMPGLYYRLLWCLPVTAISLYRRLSSCSQARLTVNRALLAAFTTTGMDTNGYERCILQKKSLAPIPVDESCCDAGCLPVSHWPANLDSRCSCRIQLLIAPPHRGIHHNRDRH